MTHPVEQHKIYKSVNDINEIDICTSVAIGAGAINPVDESWLNTFCLFANPALSPPPSENTCINGWLSSVESTSTASNLEVAVRILDSGSRLPQPVIRPCAGLCCFR